VESVGILLGEGGNVDLGARISKHILMFVFGYLSLNSYSLYILHYYYCLFTHAWYCLYAHTCYNL